MTEQKTAIPKTVEVRTDETSYSNGYEAGYSECAPKQPLYLGHPAYYWGDLLVSWLPFIIIMASLILWARKCNRKYIVKYDVSIDRQAKAIELQEKAIQLLSEISQKLDKK